MKVVVDTNVLVSGLISPTGPPGRILDLITAGQVTPLYDDRIMAEYRDVLARPKLRINPVNAGAILDLIERDGVLVAAPPLAVELPDEDDLPFLEVAEAGAALFLITGNERDYRPVQGEYTVQVASPAAFLAFWRTRLWTT